MDRDSIRKWQAKKFTESAADVSDAGRADESTGQSVRLSNALSEFIARLFVATGKEYRSTTTHPAMIRHRCKSLLWAVIRAGTNVGGRADGGALSPIRSGFSTGRHCLAKFARV
jgi:hypothetical protein